MGAGSQFHKEVVEYLQKVYKSNESLKYSFDEVIDIGRGRFQADHVFDNAWIDVVHDEGWMESLGKFIVYGNQILSEKKEFWLIFYARSLFKKYGNTRRYQGLKEESFIIEQRRHYKFYKRIAKNVLIPEIRERVRVFDYESKGSAKTGKLVEIS